MLRVVDAHAEERRAERERQSVHVPEREVRADRRDHDPEEQRDEAGDEHPERAEHRREQDEDPDRRDRADALDVRLDLLFGENRVARRPAELQVHRRRLLHLVERARELGEDAALERRVERAPLRREEEERVLSVAGEEDSVARRELAPLDVLELSKEADLGAEGIARRERAHGRGEWTAELLLERVDASTRRSLVDLLFRQERRRRVPMEEIRGRPLFLFAERAPNDARGRRLREPIAQELCRPDERVLVGAGHINHDRARELAVGERAEDAGDLPVLVARQELRDRHVDVEARQQPRPDGGDGEEKENAPGLGHAPSLAWRRRRRDAEDGRGFRCRVNLRSVDVGERRRPDIPVALGHAQVDERETLARDLDLLDDLLEVGRDRRQTKAPLVARIAGHREAKHPLEPRSIRGEEHREAVGDGAQRRLTLRDQSSRSSFRPTRGGSSPRAGCCASTGSSCGVRGPCSARSGACPRSSSARRGARPVSLHGIARTDRATSRSRRRGPRAPRGAPACRRSPAEACRLGSWERQSPRRRASSAQSRRANATPSSRLTQSRSRGLPPAR